MRKTLILIALASVVAGSPAAAAQAGKSKPAEKKYCLSFAGDTGSHIARVECRTKKDWARLGVDVDQLVN